MAKSKKKKFSRLSPEQFKEQIATAQRLHEEGKVEEAIELLEFIHDKDLTKTKSCA